MFYGGWKTVLFNYSMKEIVFFFFFPFGHLHLSVSLRVNLRVREKSFFLAHI